MDNPDPTQFITITAHKAALVDQQAAFDDIIKKRKETIAENLAAITAKDAEIAAAKAEASEVKAALTTIETAIDDPAINDADTLAIAKSEAAKSKLSKRQKEIAELDAQIAAAQARKAELRDKKN